MPNLPEVSLDRRPIKSRETTWARRVTELLAARRITPNSISLFGMFAAIVGGVCFAATDALNTPYANLAWILGGLMCQVRLLCNLFDGMVAVRLQIASRKGELYNEVPDRISDIAILVGLGYANGGSPVLGYCAAILAVFVAYVRAVIKATGAPNDYCGPMAKPQRMAVATVLAVMMSILPPAYTSLASSGSLSDEVTLDAGASSQGSLDNDWISKVLVTQEPLSITNLALVIVSIGCVITAIRRLQRGAAKLELNTP